MCSQGNPRTLALSRIKYSEIVDAQKRSSPIEKDVAEFAVGIGKAEWESDPTERRAAWSLYVELVTRISVQKDALPEGSETEAITSLYSLFAVTRDILKSAGPDVGKTKDSVGAIALAVLDRGVRPFLTKRSWAELAETFRKLGLDRPPLISPVHPVRERRK